MEDPNDGTCRTCDEDFTSEECMICQKICLDEGEPFTNWNKRAEPPKVKE